MADTIDAGGDPLNSSSYPTIEDVIGQTPVVRIDIMHSEKGTRQLLAPGFPVFVT